MISKLNQCRGNMSSRFSGSSEDILILADMFHSFKQSPFKFSNLRLHYIVLPGTIYFCCLFQVELDSLINYLTSCHIEQLPSNEYLKGLSTRENQYRVTGPKINPIETGE